MREQLLSIPINRD